MDSMQRVWLVLNHEIPDRVPIYESNIAIPDLMRKSNPAKYFQPGILHFSTNAFNILSSSYSKPIRKLFFSALKDPRFLEPIVKPAFMQITKNHRELGLDLTGFAAGLPMVLSEKIFSDFRVIDKKMIITPHRDIAIKLSDESGAAYRNGFLRTLADYEKYIELNPDHPANYFMTKKALELSKNRIALVWYVFGAAFFETLSQMFGFTTLFRLLVKEQNFIHKVVKDISDYATAVASHLSELGVSLFYQTDDLGYIGRPFISPRMYEKFFKKGVAKFCKVVHSNGGKVMMHSDGNVMEMLDTFVEVGIDALHPWEATAGMDIFEGKKKYGKKITIIGNVPIEILSFETPSVVISYVKKLMEICKPGSGYILASSHSIIPTCKLENYVAMLWANKKYGNY